VHQSRLRIEIQIVNHQVEHEFVVFMFPEAWGVGAFMVTVGFKPLS
jgi:hypothetical protein